LSLVLTLPVELKPRETLVELEKQAEWWGKWEEGAIPRLIQANPQWWVWSPVQARWAVRLAVPMEGWESYVLVGTAEHLRAGWLPESKPTAVAASLGPLA
jgi:hypothetical protein